MKISTLLRILANNVLRQAGKLEYSHVFEYLIPCKAKLLLYKSFILPYLTYKSFILPYLTYCHLTWDFLKLSDKRKIQERTLRVIYFQLPLSSTPMKIGILQANLKCVLTESKGCKKIIYNFCMLLL